MSNYSTQSKRPGGTDYEDVDMLDNYFGKHKYGVRFPDGEIYHEEDCDF